MNIDRYTTHEVKNLNLHHSLPDKRDYKIIITSPNPVSQTVDLSEHCTPVKNQRSLGTSSAFAVLGMVELINKRTTGSDEVYSEKFTYYDTRVNRLRWSFTEDTGAYLRETISSVIKAGVVLNEIYPYNDSYSDIPLQSVFESATHTTSVAYARIIEYNTELERQKTLQDCIQVLQEGYPIVAGVVCYESMKTPQNGVIPNPGGVVIGRQGILIVGYDEDNRRFKFKNSWGSDWGDHGYGYLPYEYLLKGDVWDLWTVFSQDQLAGSDVLTVEIPPVEASLEQDKAEILRLWANVVRMSQQLSDSVAHNTNVERMLSKATNSFQEATRLMYELQTQVTAHRQNLNSKSTELQKSIMELQQLLRP